MNSILKQLKEYLAKTPKEVVQAELEEYSKKYNHIGPTVDEYLQAVENSKKKDKLMTESEVMRYLISTKG
jgi:hypothetical protein